MIRSVITDSGSNIGAKLLRKWIGLSIVGIIQSPFVWIVEIV
jgi:hypothetical protein